ncbi:MAG: murein biosynthesis integral membrane protein MurJ [Kiritimatiellae bacterium]|nr:murein biosynthesis integral membrane protein MurJ [Kiritimatiellia bacterium]
MHEKQRDGVENPEQAQARKKRLLKAASVVSLMTGISRLGGLVREMAMAYFFGTSALKSAFDIAFLIPNLFRRLFGEGALSGAFVPVFNQSLVLEGRERANLLAMRVMGLLIVVLSIAVAAGVALTFLLPGFLPLGSKWLIPLPMIRLLLPYAVLICVAAMVAGMLNSVGRFAISAFAPFVLNFIWVIALALICLFVTQDKNMQIRLLCMVILVAGVLQIAIQLPLLRREGFYFKPLLWGAFSDRRVIKIVQLMGPAALTMGVFQINVFFDSFLAYWVGPYGPAALGYAERLTYLPLGLFGTAFMTVLLPAFSKYAAAGEYRRISDDLEDSLVNMTLVILPCSLGLIALALPVISMIYRTKGGAFDADSALLSSRALIAYAPGLLFFCFQKAVTPAFYALQDMKTPLRVSMAGVVLNIVLNLTSIALLPQGWKHAGIALATVVTTTVNVGVLYWLLKARIGGVNHRRVGGVFGTALAAALLMASIAASVHGALQTHLPADKVGQVTAVLASIVAGGAVYALLLAVFCRNELSHVTSIMVKRFRRKNDRG